VLQKLPHVFGGKMLNVKLIDFLAHFGGDEEYEQRQRIAVTTLRIPR
jgi:hypothetical protein